MLGISVAKSVSSKTDFLIIGENVGQSKMNDAKKHSIEIMTESEYLKKLNTQNFFIYNYLNLNPKLVLSKDIDVYLGISPGKRFFSSV